VARWALEPRTDASLAIRAWDFKSRIARPLLAGRVASNGHASASRTPIANWARRRAAAAWGDTEFPHIPTWAVLVWDDLHRGSRWRMFLTNHVATLVAIDFFAVPTLTGRILFVFVVLRHHRRRIVHVNVTAHSTAAWTTQVDRQERHRRETVSVDPGVSKTRNFRAVAPSTMTAPSASIVGVWIGRPFRTVPFLLARSSISAPCSLIVMRA
jgi:hypothetical protein